MNNGQCDLHSGVAQKVDDLAKSVSGQGKWVLWIAGIFVVVAIAITGFLWTRIDAVENKIIEKLECGARDSTISWDKLTRELRIFREKQIEIDTRVGMLERKVRP